MVKRIASAVAEPGYHHFRWRADDADGMGVGSGVYVYRMSVRDGTGKERFAQTKKMMVLK